MVFLLTIFCPPHNLRCGYAWGPPRIKIWGGAQVTTDKYTVDTVYTGGSRILVRGENIEINSIHEFLSNEFHMYCNGVNKNFCSEGTFSTNVLIKDSCKTSFKFIKNLHKNLKINQYFSKIKCNRIYKTLNKIKKQFNKSF